MRGWNERSALAKTAIVAAAIVIAVLAAGAIRDNDLVEGGTIEVARVIDGDTIELETGRRVRLVQIDAPEPSEGECFGSEATNALRTILRPGARVRLGRDPGLDDVDRFGRLLRYVFRGETLVNLELVRRGAAAPYFFRGDRGSYADDLVDAARSARQARRGLWAACPSTALEPERALDAR